MVGDFGRVEEEAVHAQQDVHQMNDNEVAVSMAVVSHCGVKSIAIDTLMIRRPIRGGEARAER